jgi:hypothetical protein
MIAGGRKTAEAGSQPCWSPRQRREAWIFIRAGYRLDPKGLPEPKESSKRMGARGLVRLGRLRGLGANVARRGKIDWGSI